MKRHKKVKILVYLCLLIILGFYSDFTLTLQILKVLCITSLAIIGCYLVYIGILYIKMISNNSSYLLYLISKNKYSKAYNIISKKYNKEDIHTRVTYDYYKTIIEHKININNFNMEGTNRILKQIEDSLRNPNLTREHRINYYFMKAENLLDLYKKTDEYSNIDLFKTILNNIDEMIELVKNDSSYTDYYNYEICRCNLTFKAYNITSDISYLGNILTNVTKLRNNLTENDKNGFYIINIENILTRIFTYSYKHTGEQSDFNDVLLHINNIEEALFNKHIRKKNKKSGYIQLLCLYEWVLEKLPDEKIQKKYDKLLNTINFNSKDKNKLGDIKDIPTINYPITWKFSLSNKVSKNIIISSLILVIIVFIYTSIVLVVPYININNYNNNGIEKGLTSLYNQLPLHDEPEAFFQNLHNNLMENGLYIPDDLNVEEKTYSSIYLDKEEHIQFICVYNSEQIINITIIINNIEEVDWDNKILPYLIAIIQADNTILQKDDATNLIKEWYNITNIPLIEYRNNRKYTINNSEDNLLIGIQCLTEDEKN